MSTQTEHRQLCTIELIAEGRAERCPGEECAFWERGCVLTRVEAELDARPEVAGLLLGLRRELGRGRTIELEATQIRSPIRAPPERGGAHRLSASRHGRGD